MKRSEEIRRIPGVAALLSLLAPGLGQAYNGHLHKMVHYWIGMVVVYTVTILALDPNTPVAFFVSPSILYVYGHSVHDAYKSALRLNQPPPP